MLYRVLHNTHYHYEAPVMLSQQLLHMSPRDFHAQTCLTHMIEISPHPSESLKNQDYFGNITDYFAMLTPHRELAVNSSFEVALMPRLALNEFYRSPPWETVSDNLRMLNGQNLEAQAFLFDSPYVTCSDELAAYARLSFTTNKPLLQAAFDLTQRIYNEFDFDPDATHIDTPLSEVLENKHGVCQDFSHLMIGCLRSLGLSCRYVSGYILTHRAPGQEDMVGADASHAWISVYCPIYGWIDFDPTNNCLVQNEHITVAWGRDFSDVSPMHGIVLGGGSHSLDVEVSVTQISDRYSNYSVSRLMLDSLT
jgi:transglutaminase-like putative cysteine protease